MFPSFLNTSSSFRAFSFLILIVLVDVVYHVIVTSCLPLAGLFAMTEQRVHDNKFQPKWIMCPTCRQHTDFGNIAYADDRKIESFNSPVWHTYQGHEKCEESMIVQGSYGTKVWFLRNAFPHAIFDMAWLPMICYFFVPACVTMFYVFALLLPPNDHSPFPPRLVATFSTFE